MLRLRLPESLLFFFLLPFFLFSFLSKTKWRTAACRVAFQTHRNSEEFEFQPKIPLLLCFKERRRRSFHGDVDPFFLSEFGRRRPARLAGSRTNRGQGGQMHASAGSSRTFPPIPSDGRAECPFELFLLGCCRSPEALSIQYGPALPCLPWIGDPLKAPLARFVVGFQRRTVRRIASPCRRRRTGRRGNKPSPKHTSYQQAQSQRRAGLKSAAKQASDSNRRSRVV